MLSTMYSAILVVEADRKDANRDGQDGEHGARLLPPKISPYFFPAAAHELLPRLPTFSCSCLSAA